MATGKELEAELLRKLRKQVREGLMRLEKPVPQAADEMWLLGGPETTSQGNWALALRNQLRQRMGLA